MAVQKKLLMRRIILILCSLMIFPLLILAQGPSNNSSTGTITSESTGEIVIPVVVHIISGKNSQFISDEQVYSQIEALNRDYNARNSDLNEVPSYFSRYIANTGIRFELAKVDPGGNSATGIVRKQTGIQIFNLDNRVKFSSRGGDNAWPRDHYLNIWVCSTLSSINGYSSKPGDAPELDGVVLSEKVFGTLNRHGNYRLGRIAVHEIGHWLGLKHIWGDTYCGDDGIYDTPKQKAYNRGCPSGKVMSCENNATGDMYMNFMDLTDDACKFMFTEGQKMKMHSLFAPGAERTAILQSKALGTPGLAIDPNWQKESNDSHVTKLKMPVYPIPAGNELTVDLSEFPAGAVRRLFVYNMVGQVVMTVSARNKLVMLDVTALQSGQYMVKTDQLGSSATKFIKL
jgi:hypothetical protein